MAIELIQMFYKYRTSSTKVDCLKADANGARTFTLRFTITYYTTAPCTPALYIELKLLTLRNRNYTAQTVHSSYVNWIPIQYYFCG
jgi:hypothetical protein